MDFKFNFLNFGEIFATKPTIPIVMQPPKITEGIRPRSFAATPDSNAPISFEEPMNIPLTAATLPRISSGVES